MSPLVIELRAGEGGRDAEAFCAELRSAITAIARHRGDTTELVGPTPRSRTLLVRITGDVDVYRELAGVHHIQRVPANDRRGRRHTSTATVAVLEARQRAAVELRDEELEVQPYRGSGPGGQHRNKSCTAVRVVHRPTGLVVTAEDSRSQWTNVQSARAKLARLIAEGEAKSVAHELAAERIGQIASAERSAKSWTHNGQRSEVVCHDTGQRWRWDDFYRGRITCA